MNDLQFLTHIFKFKIETKVEHGVLLFSKFHDLIYLNEIVADLMFRLLKIDDKS